MKAMTILFLVSLFALPAQAELPAPVAYALKKAAIPEESVAVYVQAVSSDSPIVSHNAEIGMNPASVMKLITTNAALELLDPTYRWKTEVYTDGSVKNGVLNGNLIIKGYGDPSFKAQEFWRLLMSLQQTGIKEITGNLIIDKSYFSTHVGDSHAFDDETWRAYNAMPSAFLVNGRHTSFKFTANEAGVSIHQVFELPEVQIVNRMTLGDGACGGWRNKMRYQVNASANLAVITFSGTYSPDCGEKYIELSVLNDEEYAFLTFKKLWYALGGKFDGVVKIQAVPSGAFKVLEQLSDPLGYVVRDINKWSDNLMARQLLLTMAAELGGAPATEAKGMAAINTWLASQALSFNELVVDNGSGLSRISRISAAHLGRILVNTYNGPVMPEFMASMSILSKDGTAMGRLRDSQSNGRAHLKTGSLNGVSAIAGYVLDANNHRHALVMMVNHPRASQSKAAQDALIEWVHKQP